MEDSQSCTTCDSVVTFNFSKAVTCNDIGTWEFKFNATDAGSNADETGTTLFTVTTDSIDLGISDFYDNTSTATPSTPAILRLNASDTSRGPDDYNITETLSIVFNVTSTSFDDPFKNVGSNNLNSTSFNQ